LCKGQLQAALPFLPLGLAVAGKAAVLL